MRTKLKFSLISIFVFASSQVLAQEIQFNAEEFTKELNATIAQQASEIGSADLNVRTVEPALGNDFSWQYSIPEYGFAAYDQDGNLLDVFGPETPHSINGNEIDIQGYTVPDGGSIRLLGQSGMVTAVQMARASRPNSGIQKAIDVIAISTSYVAEKLCSDPARPSKITLNLSAGFELVFNASTGSQVEWDLSEVCERYGK